MSSSRFAIQKHRKVQVTTVPFPENLLPRYPHLIQMSRTTTGTRNPVVAAFVGSIPEQEDGPPTVFFDEPSGALTKNAVTIWTSTWREAVAKHRVLVLIVSSDS